MRDAAAERCQIDAVRYTPSARAFTTISPQSPHRHGRAYFAGSAPVAATHSRSAAAHPRPAGAILRRGDVVRIVGDVALTVDYDLTGRAGCVSRLGDGG